MEVKWKQDKVSQYSCVYKNTISREETSESVVPDVLPDIARIINTDSVLYLRSKSLHKGKAVIEANIQSTILYLSEESNEVHKIELLKPVAFVFENDVLCEQDRMCVRLSVNHADTRVLNPRKILVRVDVWAGADVYRQEEICIATDKEDCDDLQLKKKECSVQATSLIHEKVFTVSEEFSISSMHLGETEMLSARAFATVDETKQVGEKMILQGSVALRLVGKVSGKEFPQTETLTCSFSQIMDCTDGADGPNAVWLTPTSMNLETIPNGHGGLVVLMELSLVAQMICRKKMLVHYIQDAYSLSGSEMICREDIAVYTNGETVTLRETVRDILETSETVQDILDAGICAGVPIIAERALRVPLNIHAIYSTSDGRIGSLFQRMVAELEYDFRGEQDPFLYPVKCQDPYFAAAAGGIEVRIPVEVKLDLLEGDTVSVIKTVEIGEENAASDEELPSLTVVRCRDTDLWSLAKKYRTTQELIESANKNTVEIGDLLLIPRPR